MLHWLNNDCSFSQQAVFKLSSTMMRQQVEIYCNRTHPKKAAYGISASLKLAFAGLMLLGILFVWCNTATLKKQKVAFPP
jgi:hypothetical protein